MKPLVLTRRRVIGAAAINGSGFILASAMALLWSLLAVRALPAAVSGQLLLALSVAGLINLLDLGASMGLTRIISAQHEVNLKFSAWHYFKTAIVVTAGGQLIGGTIAVCVWWRLSTPELSLAALTSIVVFAICTEATQLCTSALKGLLDFKSANLVSTGSTLLVYGIGIAAMLTSQVAGHVLLAMTAAQLLVAIAAIAFTVRRLCPRVEESEQQKSEPAIWPVFKNLLRTSLPLFPQMFTGIFFMHAQRFMIARYAGLDAVALVSFAYSVATRLHAVVNAFLEVIFPMARQLRAQGIKPIRFCLRAGAWSAAAYLLVSVVAAAMVHFLVPGAFTVLLVFSVGVTFAVAAAPAFHLLNGSGSSLQVSICSILSPILFVAFVLLLQKAFSMPTILLLPTSYAIAMVIMLGEVAWLVTRHENRKSVE